MEGRMEELSRELKATQEKLSAAKDQLRLQNRRARQLVAACTSRSQEKEREMHMLRVLKDGQLQSIIRKLLHFESLLRQEQKKIVDIVQQKDLMIGQQAKELDQLRQANRKLLMAASNDDVTDADVPDKSKLAKLNCGAAKNHRVADKENSGYRGNPQETPLVTKMVRRFELPAGSKTKPEVPKKPTRLANQWKTVEAVEAAEAATSAIHRCDSGSDSGSGSRSGVSRADSVNDHGYFTLEKRKHPEMRQADDSAPIAPVADEMDLRHNFEEFHLDSLEEEEHFHIHADASLLLMETPPLSLTESPIRSPGTSDRSSGDGAEWSQSAYDPPSTPPAPDCTSLSVSGSMLLPQLGDSTPTAVQFDRFLDVSGLTQKSILTPSRLLSNHKNMLKPKDVKLRSKVKAGSTASAASAAASAFHCRLNDVQHSTSQVRYYVEPFL